MIGEVSAAAEAFGVAAGMRMGEALSRCPELRLVPPDPEGVRGLWHEVLDRIESIGGRPGVRAGGRRLLRGGRHARHPRRGSGGGARGHPPGTGAQRPARRRTIQVRRLLRRPGGPSAAPSAGGGGGQGRPLPRAAARRPAALAAGAGRRCRTRSTGWESAPWASWRRFPRGRWPSASATPGCWRSTSPAGGTPRSSRAGRPSRCPSASSCPRRPPGSSSSARSSCSWRACSPARAARALAAGGGGVGAVRGRRHLARGGHASPRQRRPGPDPLVLAPKLAELPATGGLAGDRGRGLRPAGAGSGPAAGRGGRRAQGPPGRGGAPGAPGGGRRRRAAGARRGPGLPAPRAPLGPRALRGRGIATRGAAGEENGEAAEARGATSGARTRAGERRAGRNRLARRWSRCARSGWWRTAGGPAARCAGATSSWCWPTGATSRCCASWRRGGGSCKGR